MRSAGHGRVLAWIMKTILAPVDFSEVTGDVVAEAGRLARALQTQVRLLHVIAPPVIVNEYAPEMSRVSEEEALNTGSALDAWKLRLIGNDGNQQVDTALVFGPPVASILEEAARCGAEMIIMGSHGHTALYDILVGSTTGGVLHKAKCPVVVLPPPKRKPSGRG